MNINREVHDELKQLKELLKEIRDALRALVILLQKGE